MSKLLTKEQILGADRRKSVDVPVKEWGGSVRLKELTADERDMWENEAFSISQDGKSAKFNPQHTRARLVVRCIIGEDGKRMFTDDEVAAVGSLSAGSVQKLFNAAQKLNAISASDMEELEGNLGGDRADANSSTSAKGSA